MNNFNFNQDFFAACSALGGDDGRDLAWAMLSYAYTGEEPEGMGDAARACFLMARGRIDAAVAGARAKERRARPSADPTAGGCARPCLQPYGRVCRRPYPRPYGRGCARPYRQPYGRVCRRPYPRPYP